MSSRLLTEIGDLVAVLDPDKVRANSNRALDMLADRGLSDSDILHREIKAVFIQYVQTVFQGDLFMRPEDRYIGMNLRDGASHEPAERFGQTCLSMFEARTAGGLAESDSLAAVQQDLASLIMQTLALRPLNYAENRILYPGAHGAHVLRGPIFCEIYPNVRQRVSVVLGEVQGLHFRAVREAPTPSDKEDLVAMTEFVSRWISEKFSV